MPGLVGDRWWVVPLATVQLASRPLGHPARPNPAAGNHRPSWPPLLRKGTVGGGVTSARGLPAPTLTASAMSIGVDRRPHTLSYNTSDVIEASTLSQKVRIVVSG